MTEITLDERGPPATGVDFIHPCDIAGQIGRARLDVNREQVIADRRSGMSLTQVAKKHGISRASVCRLMKQASGNEPSIPALAGNVS